MKNPKPQTTPASFSVSKIHVPKAADVLASQLRKSILDGTWSEGQMLPSERVISETSGLSRSSVRDALKILELEGLLTTRTGRHGGSIVCTPSRDTIVRSVNLFISSTGSALRTLLEARHAIEPSAARLAAIHRTDQDIARIRAAHHALEADIDDLSKYIQHNMDWHMAVIRASHNDLLIAFMESISSPVHSATDLDNLSPLPIRKTVAVAHAKVMDAIVSGDPDAAERRMRRHVDAYAERVESPARAVAAEGA